MVKYTSNVVSFKYKIDTENREAKIFVSKDKYFTEYVTERREMFVLIFLEVPKGIFTTT